MRRLAILAVSAVLLTACAGVEAVGVGPDPACAAGLERRATAELYFGRNIDFDFGVTDADWTRFVDEEITSRFPSGFTVIDAAGQWRDETARIVREPSKVVIIVLAGRPDENLELDAIRQAYRTRFRQDAVMRVDHTACVGF